MQTIAGKVNNDYSIRPGIRDFVREFTEGTAQQCFVEIARARDLEACRLQGLRYQSRIVYWCRKSMTRVGGIPDDERQALLQARCACRWRGHNSQEGQNGEYGL